MSISVVGLGYGDEGKGLAVDYLAKSGKYTAVARLQGGSQCGHTVHIDNKKHVYKHFGAGTGRGLPTIWGHSCPVLPPQFVKEFIELEEKFGKTPIIETSLDSPVTTMYDIAYNRYTSRKQGFYNTTGMGIHATIKRNDFINLTLKDTKYPNVFKAKLASIRTYYEEKANNWEYQEEILKLNCSDSDFIADCEFVVANSSKVDYFNHNTSIILEGNQGVMLDRDYGFYPNVTPFKTIPRIYPEIDVMMITRAYTTRHGDGLFPGHKKDFELKNNEDETNVFNENQGSFKIKYLDLDSLKYAIDKVVEIGVDKKTLLITCLDQTDNMVYINGNTVSVEDFVGVEYLNLDRSFDILISKGPDSSFIEKFIRK